MYERLISGLILIVAVIHLLPLSGLFGADRLAALYGIEITDSNLQILMRHRAVLFALLGAFLVYAAFKPALQPLAFLAGFVSVLSFFYLAWTVGDFNAAIRKVVIADIIAFVSLIIAVILYALRRNA